MKDPVHASRALGRGRQVGFARTGFRLPPLPLLVTLMVCSGGAMAAEPESPEHDGASESAASEEPDAEVSFRFYPPRSVGGMLAETKDKQRDGPLESVHARKQALEDRTGLSLGIDNNTQYLGSDSDRSPSDAAGNVFRFYGAWTATGRGTRDEGALVFKIEDRSALGNRLSPQALGPSLGYAGLLSSTFSDAGAVLTNLYWRQHFAGGRGAFVLGQVDTTDYVDVNSVANPWDAFTNLAFEQQPALAVPSQGLGAAVLLPEPINTCASILSEMRRMASALVSMTTTSLFSSAKRPAI